MVKTLGMDHMSGSLVARQKSMNVDNFEPVNVKHNLSSTMRGDYIEPQFLL